MYSSKCRLFSAVLPFHPKLQQPIRLGAATFSVPRVPRSCWVDQVNSRDRTRLYIYDSNYNKLHKKNQSPLLEKDRGSRSGGSGQNFVIFVHYSYFLRLVFGDFDELTAVFFMFGKDFLHFRKIFPHALAG
jgi:hypothetical protein